MICGHATQFITCRWRNNDASFVFIYNLSLIKRFFTVIMDAETPQLIQSLWILSFFYINYISDYLIVKPDYRI